MVFELEDFKGWVVCGTVVTIPRTADIPTPFRPGQANANLVKRALSAVRPWQGSGGTMLTLDVDRVFPEVVVARDGLMPLWYKHKGHKAQVVQVSPFVRLRTPKLTSKLTVELDGTVGRPRLVRANPGEYHPPLPWQSSAEYIDGGIEASVEFWRTHAYVLSDGNVDPNSRRGVSQAPSWFTTD